MYKDNKATNNTSLKCISMQGRSWVFKGPEATVEIVPLYKHTNETFFLM